MTTNIDREALIASVLSSWGRRKNYFDVDGMAESAVDTILTCAGFRRQGPITDAQVEAALRKWCGPTEALWRPDARGNGGGV